MKIGIDARMIAASGIGTYIRGLVEHFPEDVKQHIILFGDRARLDRRGYAHASSRYKIYGILEQIKLPQLYKEHKLDLLHVPHYNAPLLYRGRMVVTVHDLIHVLFPQFLPHPFAKLYAVTMLRRAMRKADLVIAVSQHTKQDIMKHFSIPEKKIRVIYNGAHPVFSRKLEKDTIKSVQTHYNLPEQYILYVGNLKLSKNIPLLVKAYRSLKKRIDNLCPLVLVGKNFLSDAYWQINRDEGILIREGVRFEDLSAIYQGADLFVFPSLYEGFGLPPLEAMASGVPVVSSNAASLPEIVGAAAVLVHPLDGTGLTEAMEKLMSDQTLRNTCIAKGREQASRFTWMDSVHKHWTVYQEVLQ